MGSRSARWNGRRRTGPGRQLAAEAAHPGHPVPVVDVSDPGRLGSEDIQIYNDAYRPICGDLRPRSMTHRSRRSGLGVAGCRRRLRSRARGRGPCGNSDSTFGSAMSMQNISLSILKLKNSIKVQGDVSNPVFLGRQRILRNLLYLHRCAVLAWPLITPITQPDWLPG
jgi:hypothetical protein